MEPTRPRRPVRVHTAQPAIAGPSLPRRPTAPAPPIADEPAWGEATLGEAIYEVVWSAAALEVVVGLGHLVGAILFAINDPGVILRSILGFSALIWGLAALYLIPTLFTHLTPAPFAGEPLADDYLDAPWLDGGRPDPRPDDA